MRRCKDERALLEGPHLVAEAVAAGLELDFVLASPDLLERPEGRVLAQRLGDALETVEGDLLAAVMDADSSRGIAAVARLPRAGAAALPHRRDGVYVYAGGLQDPGNLGALARSAEAAGAAALVLSPGCVHPNHPRALRASAGSLLRLAVATGVEAADLDGHLASLEPRWVALATRGGGNLWQADLEGTLVLALGAEGPGLPVVLERRADFHLTIPLAPPVESLNATVAASLVLFEISRRRAAGTGREAGGDGAAGTP